MKQQEAYSVKREKEKLEAKAEIEILKKQYEDSNLTEEEQRRNFYESKSKHTPEYRLESSRKIREFEEAHEKARDPFRDEEYERR